MPKREEKRSNGPHNLDPAGARTPCADERPHSHEPEGRHREHGPDRSTHGDQATAACLARTVQVAENPVEASAERSTCRSFSIPRSG
jgi:hypothetical protein